MKPFTLKSAAEVVDALGGPTKAGKLVGKRAQSMSNAAYQYKRLPSDSYLIMTRELELLGLTASPELWGIMPDHQPPRPRPRPRRRSRSECANA